MPHVGGAEEILPDISAAQTPPMNDITLSRSNVARLWHSWRKKGGHTESWGRLILFQQHQRNVSQWQKRTVNINQWAANSLADRNTGATFSLGTTWTLHQRKWDKKISSAGETLVLKCFFLSALQQRYSPHHVHASSHKYISYCTKTRKQTKVQVFKIKAERK